MNFDQLRNVKEILETKSISLAAQNLFMSQPAMSQSISLLEKEIGIKLFKRSRIGSVPTDEGKIVIQKMLEILEKQHELTDTLKIVTSSFSGEIKIATSPSICMTFVLKTIARFNKDYPQIKLHIVEMEKEEIINAVKEEKFDIGLTFLFEPIELNTAINFFPLNYKGNYTALVSKNSALAHKKKVKLKELQKYPYVLYERNYMLDLLKDIEDNYGKMNIILQTSNTEIVKRAIAQNLGITITSSLLIENDPYIDSQQIIALPIDDFPLNYQFKIGGLYLKNNNKQDIIEAFLESLDF